MLVVCSTTLWVGHLSKLVHQEELSDTFGEYGDIVSIDLIPPRGCAFICMNRRQDANRALTKLKNFKLQGKAITVSHFLISLRLLNLFVELLTMMCPVAVGLGSR